MTDAMRSEFEEWAVSENYNIDIKFDSDSSCLYRSKLTQGAWIIWQACAAMMVPDGFVMVPVEPTDEMLEAMEQAIIDMGVDVVLAGEINKLAVWHDVLDAAPEGKK